MLSSSPKFAGFKRVFEFAAGQGGCRTLAVSIAAVLARRGGNAAVNRQKLSIDTLYFNPSVEMARHLRAPLRFVRADPMGRDQEAFRAINPSTRVPVLVEPGLTLWEAGAIAMRLAGHFAPAFWSQERREEVMVWVGWSSHHFTRWARGLYFERIVVPRCFPRPPTMRRSPSPRRTAALRRGARRRPGRSPLAGRRCVHLCRLPHVPRAAVRGGRGHRAGAVPAAGRLACAAGGTRGLARSVRGPD